MATDTDTTMTFNKSWTMILQPLHWALVAYYSKRRGQRRSEFLRQLIQTVVDHDKTFDPKAFKEFVMKELAEEENQPHAREVLVAQTEEFVKQKLKKS